MVDRRRQTHRALISTEIIGMNVSLDDFPIANKSTLFALFRASVQMASLSQSITATCSNPARAVPRANPPAPANSSTDFTLISQIMPANHHLPRLNHRLNSNQKSTNTVNQRRRKIEFRKDWFPTACAWQPGARFRPKLLGSRFCLRETCAASGVSFQSA